MRNFIFWLILLVSSLRAFGGYVEGMEVVRIHTKSNGFSYIWVTSPPADTCSWYAESFRFDSTTAAGKSMLANLLSAKAQGKPVTLWYGAASSAGTNQDTGCTEAGIALVSGIGQK